MAADALSPVPSASGQLLIYQDGATRLQVRLDGQTVWLSQRLIAELFQVSVPTVNEHLAGIYADRELDREATIRSFRIVQREGSRDVSRAIEHYSLDAILAVGYRVRSARGTAFRWWATTRLGEFRHLRHEHRLRPCASPQPDLLRHGAEQAALGDPRPHRRGVHHQARKRLAPAHGIDDVEERARRLEAEQPASDFDQAVEEVKRLEAAAAGREASAQVAADQKPPRRRKPKGDE